MESDSISNSIAAFGGDTKIKELIDNIRSPDETDRKQTITQIPTLLLESLRNGNQIADQILLLIYNLYADSENHETLNTSNRTIIVRHLLRLYIENIHEHQREQLDALANIIDFVHSSELLVELSYVLHKCSDNLGAQDSELVEGALGAIQEKASSNLNFEALLMIHSIKAIK